MFYCLFVDDLTARASQCKEKEKEYTKRIKDLEDKVKNAKNVREKEIKTAEKEMQRLQKKSDESRTKWKEREQVKHQ